MKIPFLSNDSPASIFFGMSSVVGLIFTVVYTVVSIYKNEFGVGANSVIITLAVVNSILGFALFLQSTNHYSLISDNSGLNLKRVKCQQKINELEFKLKNEKSINNEIAFIFHNIHDQLRDNTHSLIKLYEELLIDTTKNANYAEIIDILRITKLYNLYVANNIKDLFDKLTGSNCSVAIKMINGFVDDNDPIISTLIRDTRSYRLRRANDSLDNTGFLWHENTAFRNIMKCNNPAKYYASDELSNEKGYVNINSNWNKFYNATLVYPIRLGFRQDYQAQLDKSIIGFICVDNVDGNLNNNACIDALAAIAESLYLYFTFNKKILDVIEGRNAQLNTTTTQ